jgi:hypothetical protein
MNGVAGIPGVVLLALVSLAGCAGEPARTEHPFLLWTSDDLRAIRRRIETQPWAKKACDELCASQDKQADEIRNLFRYAVMGDKAAGQAEKQKLLGLLKAPDPLGAALEWRILAYDVLYNELAEQERDSLAQRFRRYIGYANKPGMAYDFKLFNNAVNYARYDAKDGKYSRTNWLPNIIWPWKISANLAAAALRDEKLIRDTWATPGSMKWYFDEYLCDSGFYAEEFGKMTSTPGAMLMYCMALRNLGLDELGFGYRGKGGATMRGHLESLIRITYPRVDLGSARPQYPQLTIGDLRGYPPFQYSTVAGYFADGKGGNPLWHQAGAWGGTTRGHSQQWDNDKTEKLGLRLWFELGHRFWPDAGFDYFLAQMRAPQDDKYYPTLFFGLDPVDPASAKPPPAPSAVYPERGLVMLRFDEGPSYWESPAPAAALRLTTGYAHHVNDQLALCGYYAFNRPIYLNPKSDPGYAFGFSRSVRSHCSVMVDGHIKRDDWGRTGSLEPRFTDDCATRQAFEKEVKFVAARTKKRYEGVDETRALFLTGEYLLDVFSCAAPEEHSYVWIMHAFGQAEPDAPESWQPTQQLKDLIPQLFDERSLQTEGRAWAVTVRQAKRAQEPPDSPLTAQWFERLIGARMTMLGEPGTTAYVTRTPRPGNVQNDPAGLVNGVTMLAARRAPGTTFVALHEAFQGEPRLGEFKRIAQTPQALALAVTGTPGAPVNDRLLLRIGDGCEQETTLAGEGESFTFAHYGFIRISDAEICVRGDVRAFKVRAGRQRPRLIVNGAAAEGQFAEDILTYRRR